MNLQFSGNARALGPGAIRSGKPMQIPYFRPLKGYAIQDLRKTRKGTFSRQAATLASYGARRVASSQVGRKDPDKKGPFLRRAGNDAHFSKAALK